MVVAAVAAAVLQIAVSPVFANRDGQIRVTVQGLQAPAADVVVHGGIASQGKMFGLVPLRDLGHGSWTTVLRAPGFYGVYPIRVRAQGTYHDTQGLVAVLPHGFASSLAAASPDALVEKWREDVPNGVTIAQHAVWRQGFYYHRDQRYNRLLRVKFT